MKIPRTALFRSFNSSTRFHSTFALDLKTNMFQRIAADKTVYVAKGTFEDRKTRFMGKCAYEAKFVLTWTMTAKKTDKANEMYLKLNSTVQYECEGQEGTLKSCCEGVVKEEGQVTLKPFQGRGHPASYFECRGIRKNGDNLIVYGTHEEHIQLCKNGEMYAHEKMDVRGPPYYLERKDNCDQTPDKLFPVEPKQEDKAACLSN